jgi:hypothetical protein
VLPVSDSASTANADSESDAKANDRFLATLVARIPKQLKEAYRLITGKELDGGTLLVWCLYKGLLAIDRAGNIFATIGDRSKSPPWDMAQRLDVDLGKMNDDYFANGSSSGSRPL